MRQLIIILLLVVSASGFAQEKKSKKKLETTVYSCNMHCGSCQEKIEHNIAYEKGVKAVTSELKEHTVTVTYRTDKNSKEAIKKALVKLGYKAEVLEQPQKKSKKQ